MSVLWEGTTAGVSEAVYLIDVPGVHEGEPGHAGPSHSSVLGHVGMLAFMNK